MTSQTIVRSFALPVTVHAKPHRHVDVPLGDALRADVAVARRAFDLGSNVRRVVEPDVRLRRIPEHPFPGKVTALLPHLSDLTYARPIRGNGSMAGHARPHAGKASHRTLRHGLVTVLRTRDLAPDVDIVRKLERLFDDDRATTQEVIERGSKGGTRGREDVCGLPREQLRGRRDGDVPFEEAATKATHQGQNQNEAEACEQSTDAVCPHEEITSWLASVPCCE
jgi:hypothetical protein